MTRDYNLKLSEDLNENITSRSQLPAYGKKNEILDLIKKNSVVIIQGSTGCGKTTQVSKYLYWIKLFVHI